MKTVLVAAPILIKRCPLLGLGYLAAALQSEGHEVRLLDLNTEAEVPYAEVERMWGSPAFVNDYAKKHPELFEQWVDDILKGGPELVGFTAWSCTAPCTLELARRIRARGPRPLIVLGGPEAGFKAESLAGMDFLDAVVVGEGEETFVAVVAAAARGASLRVPGARTREGWGGLRPELANLDALPFPDFSQFRLDGYFMKGTLPVSFNRGCLRHCVFCNIYESWRSYRHRKAACIHDEIAWQMDRRPGLRHFEVDCSALNLDLRELEGFCDRALAGGRRFTWGGSAVFRPEMSPALFKKLRAAGLERLDFGFESGSPKVLRLMRKGYLVEFAEANLRACREAGIETILNVIVGFPGESEEDYQRTKDFLLENRENIGKIGPPSELWIGNSNYLETHPEDFGIRLDPGGQGNLWESLDGKNHHMLRTARIADFNRWLEDSGIATATFKKAKADHLSS